MEKILGFLFPSPKLPPPLQALSGLGSRAGACLHPEGGLVCVTWQLVAAT